MLPNMSLMKNIFMASIVLVLIIIAALCGAMQISILDIITGNITNQQDSVLLFIRLPRIALALLIGAALSISGAALQGLFHNPLADPGLTGVSGGAALAVVILLVLVGDSLSGFLLIYGLSIAAFIGGILSCILVFKVARYSTNFSLDYILLTGIAVNAITSAITGILVYLSNDYQLRTFAFWTLGSLAGTSWATVIVAASIIIPAIILIIRKSNEINIFLLGEEEALSMGVNCNKLKNTLILCTSLCVGVSVATSGIIGFLSLVTPHVARLFVKADYREIMLMSMWVGAISLLVSDTVARTVIAPAEMPVGILTSMIGAPMFMWILIRQYTKRSTYK